MTIGEEEFDLFNDWKGFREGFVEDGVVSEQHYLSSDPKLCFVLKEVNDESGGGWDLRQFIREGARWQTWDNITRWVKCLGSIKDEFSWDLINEITEEDRKNTLRSICAMNLKKSPGGYTTVRASFNSVLSEDQKFIQKQYAFYKPDITVCCGTGWDLLWVLGLNESEVNETSRGIKWFINSDSKPVIMYAHPAARVQDSLLVYGLIDAVREITHNQQMQPTAESGG